MKIAGVQKTSLIDYPEQIASIIFTQGCNFACPYCHNPSLIPEAKNNQKLIPPAELEEFLERRKEFIDGVCITGGEPTLQTDLAELLSQIKDFKLKIKLDTNGTNPEVLKKLINQNLVDYLAMDIKGPLASYNQYSKQQITTAIKNSIKLITESDLNYEFRTTVVPGLHNTEDITKISQVIQGTQKYYIQNFRPHNTLDPDLADKNGFPPAKLEEFKTVAEQYVDQVNIRN